MLLTKDDLNNLSFLLKLEKQEDWDKWSESCDEDDLEYAIELLSFVKENRMRFLSELG